MGSSRRARGCSSCCALASRSSPPTSSSSPRRGAELFSAASEAGVQLRFEASVCAAIPVIKVLRESLVVSNVHRVLGIVNGTTNFILTRMVEGEEYGDGARRGAAAGLRRGRPDGGRDGRRRGREDGDPRDRRLRLARRLRRGRLRRHRRDHERAGRCGAAVLAHPAPDRLGDARRRPGRRPRAALARRRPPSARRGYGRVQRGHAPGRRDPRDHARRPGRGRDGDGVVGRRGHGLDRRHGRNRVPPQRRGLAGARAAADSASCARRSISISRSTTAPACSRA